MSFAGSDLDKKADKDKLVIANNSGGGPCGYKVIAQLEYERLKTELNEGRFGQPGTASEKVIKYLLELKSVSDNKEQQQKVIDQFKLSILSHQPHENMKDTPYLTVGGNVYKHMMLGEQAESLLVKLKENKKFDQGEAIYCELKAFFDNVCENKGVVTALAKDSYKNVLFASDMIKRLYSVFVADKNLSPDEKEAMLITHLLTNNEGIRSKVWSKIGKNEKCSPQDIYKLIEADAKENKKSLRDYLADSLYAKVGNQRLADSSYADLDTLKNYFPNLLDKKCDILYNTQKIPPQFEKGKWYILHQQGIHALFDHWVALIPQSQFTRDVLEGVLFEKFGKFMNMDRYPVASMKEITDVLKSVKFSLAVTKNLKLINQTLDDLVKLADTDMGRFKDAIDTQAESFSGQGSDVELAFKFLQHRLNAGGNLLLLQREKMIQQASEVRSELAFLCVPKMLSSGIFSERKAEDSLMNKLKNIASIPLREDKEKAAVNKYGQAIADAISMIKVNGAHAEEEFNRAVVVANAELKKGLGESALCRTIIDHVCTRLSVIESGPSLSPPAISSSDS